MTKITKNGRGYFLHYGGDKIPFDLSVKDRKRLSISVHPDLSVTVVAPEDKTLEQVLGRVQYRAAWIQKQRRYFSQFLPSLPPKQYVSGETHYYLGRQYRLKVRSADQDSVKLIGRFLIVDLPKPKDQERVKSLVCAWYRNHAQSLFEKKLDAAHDSASSLKVKKPKIQLRHMKTRWGSCTKNGTILLNPELIKAPIHCIEYVILHELFHLKVHNHGKLFYLLLSRQMPDWKKRKEKLDGLLLC